MKNVLPFVLVGIGSLLETLKVGLIGYSTDLKPICGTTVVYLFLVDGRVVKIYSEMHDLGNWNEVGSLIFEAVGGVHSKMTPLQPGWRQIASAEKLVLNTEEFMAESGVFLRSHEGEDIVIVTSANVDTLAVRAPNSLDAFLPENDLASYQHVPLD
jgi:hypothetical protein